MRIKKGQIAAELYKLDLERCAWETSLARRRRDAAYGAVSWMKRIQLAGDTGFGKLLRSLAAALRQPEQAQVALGKLLIATGEAQRLLRGRDLDSLYIGLSRLLAEPVQTLQWRSHLTKPARLAYDRYMSAVAQP